MNKERLLNVAKACRESPHPEKFSMERIMHSCGTPACALGHYAARADLQDEFQLLNPREIKGPFGLCACDGVALVSTGLEIGYDTGQTLTHFDIDEEQNEALFGMDGCGEARSATDAAEFIENFVDSDGQLDDDYV